MVVLSRLPIDMLDDRASWNSDHPVAAIQAATYESTVDTHLCFRLCLVLICLYNVTVTRAPAALRKQRQLCGNMPVVGMYHPLISLDALPQQCEQYGYASC